MGTVVTNTKSNRSATTLVVLDGFVKMSASKNKKKISNFEQILKKF
jgi:hypothetical protein